jgi:hypothetical protein
LFIVRPIDEQECPLVNADIGDRGNCRFYNKISQFLSFAQDTSFEAFSCWQSEASS